MEDIIPEPTSSTEAEIYPRSSNPAARPVRTQSLSLERPDANRQQYQEKHHPRSKWASERPRSINIGHLSRRWSRTSRSGLLLSSSSQLARQSAVLEESSSALDLSWPRSHFAGLAAPVRVLSIDQADVLRRSDSLNNDVLYMRPSFTEKPDMLNSSAPVRRGQTLPTPVIGGLHKWQPAAQKTQSLPRFRTASPALGTVVFEESELEDDEEYTSGDDECEESSSDDMEIVIDELDMQLLKSQRRLSRTAEAQQQSSDAGVSTLPGEADFYSMLLRDISSLRTLLHQRKAMAVAEDGDNDDQYAKNVQSYHRRYVTNTNPPMSVSDSGGEDTAGPQPPFLSPSLSIDRVLRPRHKSDSAAPELTEPAALDEHPDNLQDCSCAASQLPLLDEQAIESVLSKCHDELFHNLPDLQSSVAFAEQLANEENSKKKFVDLWLQQAAEMLHVVNEQRQMALSAFSCSLDAFRVAGEEQAEFMAMRRQEKEQHDQHIGAVEAAMSKQIANLLRVVERQESQLVHQQRQIKRLTEQASRVRDHSVHRAVTPSGLPLPFPTQDTRKLQVGAAPSHAVSMPHLNKILTSPPTPGFRSFRHRPSSNLDLNSTDGELIEETIEGDRHQLAASGRFDTNPRWMARAVSWLDMNSKIDEPGES